MNEKRLGRKKAEKLHDLTKASQFGKERARMRSEEFWSGPEGSCPASGSRNSLRKLWIHAIPH